MLAAASRPYQFLKPSSSRWTRQCVSSFMTWIAAGRRRPSPQYASACATGTATCRCPTSTCSSPCSRCSWPTPKSTSPVRASLWARALVTHGTLAALVRSRLARYHPLCLRLRPRRLSECPRSRTLGPSPSRVDFPPSISANLPGQAALSAPAITREIDMQRDGYEENGSLLSRPHAMCERECLLNASRLRRLQHCHYLRRIIV